MPSVRGVGSGPLLVGAVAYDPKVVTIWEGFKSYFQKRGVEIDYVLYSNYDAQVRANLSGEIDVAWNSPLAWVKSWPPHNGVYRRAVLFAAAFVYGLRVVR